MKEKVKELLIARHPVGGIRTYFKYIYSNELFSQYQFTVVTSESGIKDYLASIFVDGQYICKETPQTNIGFSWEITKALMLGKYHLVHSHGFTAGLLIAPLTKLFGVPHLMTVHDIFQDSQFSGRLGVIKRHLISIALRMVNVSMAVGDDAKENLISYYPFLEKNNKLVSVQNGIDVIKFNETTPRDFRTELGLSKECIILDFFADL